MPLKKLTLKPGVNRENTRYTSEGGWYDCDKIRFRQGTPEKIGGWVRFAMGQFLGICRSITGWVTLGNAVLAGLGTSLKYYIFLGGTYYDITPLKETTAAGDVTFAAVNGSAVITVTDVDSDTSVGDFVTFSGAVTLGGNITADVLNAEYQVASVTNADTYTIVATATADASDTGNGGASTVGAYQLPIGPASIVPYIGWGAGTWSFGTWGVGGSTSEALRLWNAANFGEDLIYGPKDGAIYYWDATNTVNSRGVLLSSLPGASDVPLMQNNLIVSAASRFVLAFGVNELGDTLQNPMLIRWSDQENPYNWTPAVTNQAGGITLSDGSRIVAVQQQRQEILVWTDTALYSLQYLGPPYVWGVQLVGALSSIISSNATVTANNVTYWMGNDKFYVYDGTLKTLKCDLRQFIFDNADPDLTLDILQSEQVFSGTVAAFNEAWWFYSSVGNPDSSTCNRYVVFNYVENIWYYGSLDRTAWYDSRIVGHPLAATPNGYVVQHETGVNNGEGASEVAISAYVTSSEFDIDDGHNFGFVWRILPDLTFRGSTAASPSAIMSLYPLKNAGSGYTDPASVAGVNYASVTRTSVLPIEAFTGQIYTRVRGRQMAIKIESNSLGTTWQLGAPRIDIRPDGRR